MYFTVMWHLDVNFNALEVFKATKKFMARLNLAYSEILAATSGVDTQQATEKATCAAMKRSLRRGITWLSAEPVHSRVFACVAEGGWPFFWQ